MGARRIARRVLSNRWLGRGLRAGLAVALAPWAVLIGAALSTRLPSSLEHREPTASASSRDMSVRVLDRNGALLRDLRNDDSERFERRPLADFGDRLPKALVAAEDKRFYEHPGVDPIAMTRALVSSVVARRVVSGASTLSQQLARVVSGARRTWSDKLGVMALAVRIEASLSKDEILEEYLNRVSFGPQVRGAEAASRFYFDKPAHDLSLAEAATLAGIPRGPTLYDPRKHADRLVARRDRILDRMLDGGFANADEVRRAKAEPLVVSSRFASGGAPHFVRAVVAGDVDPCAAKSAIGHDVSSVKTTLDSGLQREVTELARSTLRGLDREHVTAASVIVLDNATGDVLAYVGSPDASDAARLGENDGVRALRQPGSSLKPFVYELGMERLGMSPTTLLFDVDTTFRTAQGDDYRPRNYDEKFHGPVLLRDALGNSFNVPAVATVERIGVAPIVERLRGLGFCSLTEPPSHYGLGVALGDPEVRLVDLANAYATLARGGLSLPVRSLASSTRWDGAISTANVPAPVRVLDERAAWLVTDVLSDKTARLASFGEESVLELPFAVAAKTGTSKGYRDNITVGYTPEVTVAVWVGNFDGSPMNGVSGITGAGPLFRGAMLAASRLRPPTAFVMPEGVETIEVCPLSGKERGADCPPARVDHRATGRGDTVSGGGHCDMHVRADVERDTGHLAGPGCARELVETLVFEAYPAPLRAWAIAAGRPLLPSVLSARCPGARVPERLRDTAAIEFPADGARFFIDPSSVASSAIRIRALAPEAAHRLELSIDGNLVSYPRGGLEWRLVKGHHALRIVVDGESSDPTSFDVE